MAQNDIIVPREGAGGVLTEIVLPDATTTARGLLSSADKTKLDSAAWALEIRGGITLSADETLTTGRNVQQQVSSFSATTFNVTLPISDVQAGDTFTIIGVANSTGGIVIRRQNWSGDGFGPQFTILATAVGSGGAQRFSFRAATTASSSWALLPVDTHTQPASTITGLPTASTATPSALGVAAAGTSADFSRADHVHAMPSASDVGAAAATHAASHAAGGSDPLAPSDIGAQSIFITQTIISATTLTAQRARIYEVMNFGAAYTITMPSTDNIAGDTIVFRSVNVISNAVTLDNPFNLSDETLTATGQQLRYIYSSAGGGSWQRVPVDTHTHAASAITSGTLDIARIPTGTGSTQVALGDHGHGNITTDGKLGSVSGLPVVTTTAGAVTTLALGTAGQVLTVNSGATGVEFAAASGGGVSAVNSTLADILSVSGSDLVADDLGADKLYGFDDSEGKAIGFTIGSGLSVSGDTLSATATGTIGGSTGSTDNLILRSDGTGAATLQNSALQLDDATTSTQANVAIVNAHSETNSALVMTPKGTGAFIVGPKPDGTSTGGNARGSGAICIQPRNRSNANQVASGTGSIAIGSQCRSTAGGVAIGSNCDTSDGVAIGNGAASVSGYGVSIGFTGVTGQSSVSIGSFSTSASAQSAIAIGNSTTATSNVAVAIGSVASGDSPLVASLRGQFLTWGWSTVFWGGQTTNNTATVLNIGIGATNRFTIAANTALIADIHLIARRSDVSGKWLAARRFVAIRRDGSNNTSLIGTVQTIGTDQSEGSPTWTFALTADDTNEALQLEVTGATSETVQWRATAFYRVV